MQNYAKGNYYIERNIVSSDRFPRRMSTSGFEYPKDLSNVHYSPYFQSIPENKYQNILPQNMYHTMNGDSDKKCEIVNSTFYSENNVNLPNSITTNIFDPQYQCAGTNHVQRFCSTPSIPLDSIQEKLSDQPYFDTPLLSCAAADNAYNRQMVACSQICQNGASLPYFQSPFLLYDQRTNSFQNVFMYNPSVPASMDSEMISNGNNTHDFSQGYQPTDFIQNNDAVYFLPSELPNDTTTMLCTESRSLPSLHGDDSPESDFESSDDEQFNTVHGDEMLQELQKLSSVFTNIVNMPVSRRDDLVATPVFPSHSNLSRFKKTRVEERTTLWHTSRFIVKDNLVKIIPENILRTQPITDERMDRFDNDVLGRQLPVEADVPPVASEIPDCVHTICTCHTTPSYSKHSNRTNPKYRSNFVSHSPIDRTNSIAQQLHPNFVSLLSHRKSLQIPVRIPIMLNPVLPMKSPASQLCARMFVETPNIPTSNKSSRRKRRWSVSGTILESNYGLRSARPHNHKTNSESNRPNKFDFNSDIIETRHSLDLQDLDECNIDQNPQFYSSLESKLDKQLVTLKRTIMSYVEYSLGDIRDEIRALRDNQSSLEKELRFYKDKVSKLEDSVRQNLPAEQWKLYGVVETTNCQP